MLRVRPKMRGVLGRPMRVFRHRRRAGQAARRRRRRARLWRIRRRLERHGLRRHRGAFVLGRTQEGELPRHQRPALSPEAEGASGPRCVQGERAEPPPEQGIEGGEQAVEQVEGLRPPSAQPVTLADGERPAQRDAPALARP